MEMLILNVMVSRCRASGNYVGHKSRAFMNDTGASGKAAEMISFHSVRKQ